MRIGLTGVVTCAPRDLRPEVDRMSEALFRVAGASLHDDVVGGQVCVRLRMAPWASAKSACASMAGSQAWVVGAPRDRTGIVDAQALLRRWLAHGPQALADVGGSFAMLVWEPVAQRATLVSDRLGVEKLYYCIVGDSLLVASELAGLRAHPASPSEIDELAVAQYLITSHLFEPRSLVRGVHLVPAGSQVQWVNGRTSVTRYWHPAMHAGAQPGTLDDWVDRLHATLAGAMHRGVASGSQPLLLPISGGLDSRCLAGALPGDAIPRTQACTFGPRWSNDVRFGRLVANTLGVSHRVLEIPKRYFRDDLPLALALADGEIAIEAFPLLQLRRAAGPDRMALSGYLGGMLSGSLVPAADAGAERGDPFDIFWQTRYVKMGFTPAMLDDVLVPERARAVRDATRQAVADAWGRADADTSEERAFLTELGHRQTRYIAYGPRVLAAYGPAWMPFLEPDVVDDFLALPIDYRRGQLAYRRLMQRYAPALAALPEAKTGRPMRESYVKDPRRQESATPSPWAGLPLLWRLEAMRRAARRSLERWGGGWLSARKRLHYAHHDDDIRFVDPGWFRRALLEDPLADDWFRRDRLARLFDEHQQRRANHAVRINNVICFLAWRRHAGL